MRFGGKEVVLHIIDRMEEAGVTDIAILAEKNHAEEYRKAVGEYDSGVLANVEETSGLGPVSSFIYGVEEFYEGDSVIAISDDNLFTFSLAPLAEASREQESSVLAVRDRSLVCANTGRHNFGRVVAGADGKIKSFSHSFFKPFGATRARLISLDIWLFHPDTVSSTIDVLKAGGLSLAMRTLLDDLVCIEMNDGFWADVGKTGLRETATAFFAASQQASVLG